MSQHMATLPAARVAEDLHWVTSRLFSVLSAWAGEADHPSIAVSMATTSRHLGWHVSDLAELLPETEDPDEAEEPQPPLHPAVDAALDAIRAIPGSTERLAVAHRVLLPRLAVECVAIARGSKPDEERDPVVGIAEALLGDIRRDRDDGEFLLVKLISDGSSVARVGERVLEAERRLVEAGGLVPVTVA